MYYKLLKKKEKKNLNAEDKRLLERIIYMVNMEILQDWAKKVAKVYHDDITANKDKMKSVKSFFTGIGGLFGKK